MPPTEVRVVKLPVSTVPLAEIVTVPLTVMSAATSGVQHTGGGLDENRPAVIVLPLRAKLLLLALSVTPFMPVIEAAPTFTATPAGAFPVRVTSPLAPLKVVALTDAPVSTFTMPAAVAVKLEPNAESVAPLVIESVAPAFVVFKIRLPPFAVTLVVAPSIRIPPVAEVVNVTIPAFTICPVVNGVLAGAAKLREPALTKAPLMTDIPLAALVSVRVKLPAEAIAPPSTSIPPADTRLIVLAPLKLVPVRVNELAAPVDVMVNVDDVGETVEPVSVTPAPLMAIASPPPFPDPPEVTEVLVKVAGLSVPPPIVMAPYAVTESRAPIVAPLVPIVTAPRVLTKPFATALARKSV